MTDENVGGRETVSKKGQFNQHDLYILWASQNLAHTKPSVYCP